MLAARRGRWTKSAAVGIRQATGVNLFGALEPGLVTRASSGVVREPVRAGPSRSGLVWAGHVAKYP